MQWEGELMRWLSVKDHGLYKNWDCDSRKSYFGGFKLSTVAVNCRESMTSNKNA